jgi:outer membrane protein assembly factor BamB
MLPIARRAAMTLAASIALAGCGAGSGGLSAAGRSGPTTAGPVSSAGSGWPALLHGPSHFGAATVTGPTRATVRWRRALGGPIVPGPVVSADNVAYVGSDNGVLHAIDVATGSQRWSFDGGADFGVDLSTAPLLLAGGELIWPGPQHRLYGLSAAGKLRWTLPAGADLLTPVLDRNGLLVVADQAGQISGYRLGAGFAKPMLVWTHRLASSSFGNPVIAADGTIYQTAGNDLFALSSGGTIRWTVKTPKAVEVSPAVAVGGIVVFGSDNRDEYGVDPDGTLRWRIKIGNYTYSSPLTLPGRQVIFGNHSGQMTLLNSDTGKLLHRDQGQGELWTAAAVDERGDAYFASRTGQIYGFTGAGRELLDFNAGGKFDSYPALAPNGTLLIGSDTGTLYAIG